MPDPHAEPGHSSGFDLHEEGQGHSTAAVLLLAVVMGSVGASLSHSHPNDSADSKEPQPTTQPSFIYLFF